MNLEGIRHLIECHCILPQFRNRNPAVYHKFVVFSIVEEDAVKPKLAQCNNCGIVHRVIDLCKSEIVHGAEEGSSIRNIDDIKLSLPQKISDFLSQQKSDVTIWEFVEFLLENNKEAEIVLSKDQQGDITQVKILHVKSDGTFKVKSETRQDELEVE